MNEKVMTPEEVNAFKEAVMKAVEGALEAVDTKGAAIQAVCEAVEALKEEPEMKGMGEESENGMSLPGEEE